MRADLSGISPTADMSILFACDLDNTLLYSYKHKREDDICVELLKGREQGFMSRNTCELLKKVMEKTCFIPITTRSCEQYSRIKWEYPPDYAVSANGGILLHNYDKDDEWYEESIKCAKEICDEMTRLRDFLIGQDRFIRCRIVDEMYLFAYCKDNVDPEKCAEEYAAITRLDVISSGKKIYFFPRDINKGAALSRLIEKFRPRTVISAGDSEIDIPMLCAADIAIVPSEDMADKIGHKNIYINNEDNFPEFVLKKVLEISE